MGGASRPGWLVRCAHAALIFREGTQPTSCKAGALKRLIIFDTCSPLKVQALFLVFVRRAVFIWQQRFGTAVQTNLAVSAVM